jgi:hypothetical protein
MDETIALIGVLTQQWQPRLNYMSVTGGAFFVRELYEWIIDLDFTDNPPGIYEQ